MASRRLDISSLLCDDNVPEPVILAPHLRNPASAASSSYAPSPPLQFPHPHRPSPSHSQPISSPPNPYPPPSPKLSTKLSYSGLEALVHAATEERRRLSGGNASEPDIPRHTSLSPVDQRQHYTHQRQHRPQPSEHYQHQHQSPILSPLQTMRSPVETIHSPAQSIRSPAYSPHLQHQPQPRQRIPDRHRIPHDDPQIRMSPVEDLHHRSQQPAFYPHHSPQPQPSRQQIEHEHRMHLELQRQRQHHEQLLLQEQHQQQQLARERQMAYVDRTPSLPSHRLPSMPLQIEVPSQPHPRSSNSIYTSGRKSDPGQLHHVLNPAHAETTSSPPFQPPQQSSLDQILSHPNKKRRYSDSPARSISTDEQERLHREREKMATGDLGYGRLDVPATTSIRRPGSGQGSGRKQMGLADLISPPGREPIYVAAAANPAVGLRDGQTLLSPPGRRSPPGSYIGRAKAARKSEEIEHSLHAHVPQPLPERGRPVEREEKKKSRSRVENDVHPPSEPVHSKVQRVPPPAPPPLPTKIQEEDAHEWFLEHYDEYPAPAASKPPSSLTRSPSPPVTISLHAVSPTLRTSASPAPKKQTPTPATMPEAAVALEQELEELVATPAPVISKVEPDVDDMDVDLAVTELVAETLDADDAKIEDIGMEVDVEDELLSLVDDRPPPPHINRRTSGNSSTSGPSTKQPPPLRAINDSSAIRPASPSTMSVPSPVGFLSPVVRASSTRPTSDRGSMPPPASVASGRNAEKDEKKGGEIATAIASAPKKKKEGSSKPKAKPANGSVTTAAAKSRAKPGPKPKSRNPDAFTPPIAKTKGPGKKTPASRSRSTSVLPSGSAGPESSDVKAEKQEEEESDDHEDDKLYCVCKTTYDEDRFMIACDRCDEWYHTQCVKMPDLEVDLVDQFICPPCIDKNPHLSLRTTYKSRCLFGLKHPDPSSSKACHRPARGAFSKYCSDECGVKYMQSRVDAWAKKGGKKEKLWETVKNADKREGVVVCADDMKTAKVEITEGCRTRDEEKAGRAKYSQVEREVQRLNNRLESVVKLREEIKKGMEVVVWREKLLELATERAEQIGQCGWDQRICFGDEEWADFGAGVLESYEDMKSDDTNGQAEERPADGEGEWWCPGKQICDRHAGWQTVRYRDVCKEKEIKEDALLNLTTRERAIRKRIEDILDPHGRNCNDSPGKSPLKASNTKLSNVHTKGKANGDTTKKGKKRKAPS